MFIQLQYTGYEVQSPLVAVTSFTFIISSHIKYPSEAVARTDGGAGRKRSKADNEAQEAEERFNAAVLTKTV